jgi:TolB protein
MAVTDHKNLYVVDLATGEEKTLFENAFEYIFAGFNWSPDGKWLALSAKASPKSQRQLLLVRADGEKSGRKLLQTSEQGGSISFSPDGKQLVFADDLLLRLIDTSGEGESRLIPSQKFHGRDPHWSPDGKWIVYAGELPE